MRIQPNPSLDTSGPFFPKFIFVVVIVAIRLINYTKINVISFNDFPLGLNLLVCMAQGLISGDEVVNNPFFSHIHPLFNPYFLATFVISQFEDELPKDKWSSDHYKNGRNRKARRVGTNLFYVK
jgi:hypothetical protein